MSRLTERMQFALSVKDRETIEEAARRERRTVSEWLRLLSVKHAQEVIASGRSAVS